MQLMLHRMMMGPLLHQLVTRGFKIENIRIHPDCFPSGNRRGILFGCKVLGTYVGHSDYVEANIDTKIPKLQHVAEVLLKYPYQQGRFLLHMWKVVWMINPRETHLWFIIDALGADARVDLRVQGICNPLILIR